MRKVTDLEELAKLLREENRDWAPGFEYAILDMVRSGLAEAYVDKDGTTGLTMLADEEQVAEWVVQ